MRARVERILAFSEAKDAAAVGQPARRAMQRFLGALDELSRAADALATADSRPHAPAASAARALLVGSDPSLASRLRADIGTHRAEIASPKDALRSVAAHPPDVVVACDATALDAVHALHEICPGAPAVLVVRAAAVAEVLRRFASHPAVLVREPVSAEELAFTIRGMLALAQDRRRAQTEDAAAPSLDPFDEPRSYAHLAGLLPRALEGPIRFEVSATVIKRLDAEPIVETYAASEVPEAALRDARELAISLCGAGAEARERIAGSDTALHSVLYRRLETNGRVVGAVVLAASRPDAFSPDDERLLTALAARATAAYLRLEAWLMRLRLTPRQSQVLSLIASGHSDKEIAGRLGVSHRTVRTHLDRLLREHGLHSRTEAVAAWLRSQQA